MGDLKLLFSDADNVQVGQKQRNKPAEDKHYLEHRSLQGEDSAHLSNDETLRERLFLCRPTAYPWKKQGQNETHVLLA